MHIDLSGRTAVVTGSTAGIGYAIAKGLADAGASVVVNGRTAESVDRAVERLKADVKDATVRGIAADCGTAEGCATLIAAVPDPDILVNNVGIYGPEDFFEVDDATWQRFFEVNVMSGVRLSRALVPGMVARGWGRVLFISSESALNIPVAMIHYGFTKTANLSVSRGLAKRLAGSGVTVNAILPGPTMSDGLVAAFGKRDRPEGMSLDDQVTAFVKQQRPSSIIGRAATVEEVANLVVYAASTQASATTGAALRVDGGVVDTIA